jgi:branched-chain amino acid transport system permease protein
MAIQVLNGLVYGALLYILSVGLVLIFGLRRVVNFAHGSLFMLGAYVGLTVASVAGFWVGLVASMAVLAILGVLLDIGVFRPLRLHDPVVTVLVTFGLLLVIEDFALTVWGKDFYSLQIPSAFSGNTLLGDLSFPSYRLFVIATAAAVAIALSMWLRLSRIGLYVRASAVDPVTTGMQGVNTDRVSMVVVSVGAALAGLAGTIAAPLTALSPSMGGSILVDSFIVVVLGGLSSFGGAFIAAILIGQLHNFGVVYLPWAATMLPLLLMAGILFWRPAGMSGIKE